jgi:hypothetical protein
MNLRGWIFVGMKHRQTKECIDGDGANALHFLGVLYCWLDRHKIVLHNNALPVHLELPKPWTWKFGYVLKHRGYFSPVYVIPGEYVTGPICWGQYVEAFLSQALLERPVCHRTVLPLPTDPSPNFKGKSKLIV